MEFAKGHFKVEKVVDGEVIEILADQSNLFTDLLKHWKKSALEATTVNGVCTGTEIPIPMYLELLSDTTPATKDNVTRPDADLGVCYLGANEMTGIPDNMRGSLVTDECSVVTNPDGSETHTYVASFGGTSAIGTINKLRVKAGTQQMFLRDSNIATSWATGRSAYPAISNTFFGGGTGTIKHGYISSVARLFSNDPAYRNAFDVTDKYVSFCNSNGFYIREYHVVKGLPSPQLASLFMDFDTGGDPADIPSPVNRACIDSATGNACAMTYGASTTTQFTFDLYKKVDGAYSKEATLVVPLGFNYNQTSDRACISFQKEGVVGLAIFTQYKEVMYIEVDIEAGTYNTVIPKTTVGNHTTESYAEGISADCPYYDREAGVLYFMVTLSGTSGQGDAAGITAFDTKTSKFYYIDLWGATNLEYRGLKCATHPLKVARANFVEHLSEIKPKAWGFDYNTKSVYAWNQYGITRFPLNPLLHDVLSETVINPIEKTSNDSIKITYTLTIKTTNSVEVTEV